MPVLEVKQFNIKSILLLYLMVKLNVFTDNIIDK